MLITPGREQQELILKQGVPLTRQRYVLSRPGDFRDLAYQDLSPVSLQDLVQREKSYLPASSRGRSGYYFVLREGALEDKDGLGRIVVSVQYDSGTDKPRIEIPGVYERIVKTQLKMAIIKLFKENEPDRVKAALARYAGLNEAQVRDYVFPWDTRHLGLRRNITGRHIIGSRVKER